MNSFKIKNLKFKIDQRGLVRFTKKSLITIFTAWIIVVGTGLIYMFNPWVRSVEAVWYDDNWSYRQRVPIDTHTASETNVYNEISVDTATLTTDKLQADCDDLRFTKENGEVLPYQIVSGCDSATTVINVGFDTMPIAPFNIYMYYGNSTAGAGSSTLIHTACGNGCAEGTLASEEKAPSPVAHWRFDDGTGTNAQDSTTNNNDGTISGATWQTEDMCVSGKCLKFDGSDDYVEVANSASNNLSTAAGISVSAWIKLTTLATTGIIGKWDSAVGGRQFSLDTVTSGSTYASFSVSGSGTTRATRRGDTALSANQWYHIVGVWKNDATMSIYVNGKLQTLSDFGSNESIPSSLNSSTRNLCIAIKNNANSNNCATNTQAFPGFIDEPKIYNYARSAAQIQADYNARATGEGASAVLGAQSTAALNNGLIGYWKMDESSANTCTGGVNDSCDSSGNGNNGAWNGNATSAAGKFGNGTTFDGSGDYTSVADSTIFDSTTMTISAWIYKDSLSSGDYREIFSKVAGGSDRYVLGAYDPTDNKIHAYIDDASNCEVTSDNALTASTWTHVAVSLDGSRHKLYINGALNDDVACTETWSSVGGNISWGAYSTTDDYWNGDFDEARIYNRALSSNEVSQLYNFAPGPVAYYNMEEPSGNISDKSGNGNTGTVTGTTSANGKYGKARSFNGTDDYINAGAGSTLNMTGDMSFSFWANPDTLLESGTSDDSVLFYKGVYQSNGYYIQRNCHGAGRTGSLCFVTNQSAASQITESGDGALAVGIWNHFAITRSGTSVKIYKNGVEMTYTSQESHSNPSSSSDSFQISKYSTNTTSYFFDGKLDDVRIYNYARTQKQIVSDMNGTSPFGASLAGSQRGAPSGAALGHWKFDEGVDNRCSGGSNDACNSGNGGSALDGAISGMASPATSTSGWTQSGKVGRGLVFDGTDDYVTVTNNTSLTPATGLTVSVWIKYAATPTALHRIVHKENSAPSSYSMYSFNGDNAIYFTLNGSTAAATTTTSWGTGWHHVVGTYDLTNIKIYVDGKLEGTTPYTTTLTSNTGPLTIGANSSGGAVINGSIDEVKIYNYALTADEVKVDMNLGSSQVLGASGTNSSSSSYSSSQEYCIPGDSSTCTAPVGRWDFEEGTGTTAYDKSGNANNGTLTGGPTWANGKVGKGLSFDGSDDYVSTSYTPAYINNLTISAWIKRNNTATIHVIASTYNGTGDSGFIFDVFNTNKLSFWTQNSRIQSTGTITDTNWHHVAVTVSGSNVITFYIDGAQAGSSTGSGGNTVSSLPFLIGAQTTAAANPFNGKIDNVRLFNYARTAAQVAWDYNRGAPVGHWKMDECQGTSIKDWSGNANHGTLTVGASGTQTSAGTCSGSANTAWKDGVTGKINYSLDFDGTDDYVDLGDPSSGIFDPGTGDFTLAFWMKWADNQPKTILSKDNWAGNGNGWLVYTDGASLYYWTGSELSLGSLPASWLHVAITRSGTSITTYVDGKQKSTGTDVRNLANTITLKAGGANDAGKYFSGQIDDVRVYNYALSSTQVKDLFNGGATSFKPVTGAP